MRHVGGPEIHRNLLIDVSNISHRSYHGAIKNEPDISSTRFYGQYLKNFLDHVKHCYLSLSHPHKVFAVFDGKPTRRTSLYDGYKKNRSGLNVPTFDHKMLLESTLRAMGISVVKHHDEEADDLIYSFVTSRPDESNTIVSDDKDFFGLLTNPRTILYRPGYQGQKFFDRFRAQDYMSESLGIPGFSLSNFVNFKSYVGDRSDNIPGVPKLRKKLAYRIAAGETVSDLYGYEMENLKRCEKQIALNRDLVSFILVENINSHISKSDYNKDQISEISDKYSVDIGEYKCLTANKTSYEIPTEDWMKDI